MGSIKMNPNFIRITDVDNGKEIVENTRAGTSVIEKYNSFSLRIEQFLLETGINRIVPAQALRGFI